MLEKILLPQIDTKRELIHWECLNYGVLSGGEKAAVSWARCVWNDKQVPTTPAEWEEYPGYPMRDPFEGFGIMEPDLHAAVLSALAYWWG